MRPSVALLGFLMGSSGAICFGLFGVAIVFRVLGPEHPELAAEVGPLLTHLLRFAVLAGVSAVSFWGLVRERPWRRWSVLALVLVFAGVVLSYSLAGR